MEHRVVEFVGVNVGESNLPGEDMLGVTPRLRLGTASTHYSDWKV
jgi:hypothetical protein